LIQINFSQPELVRFTSYDPLILILHQFLSQLWRLVVSSNGGNGVGSRYCDMTAGPAEVLNAFQVSKLGATSCIGSSSFCFTLVAGLVTFENPLLAAALLTFMLGFCPI